VSASTGIECFDSSASPVKGCSGCELAATPEGVRMAVVRTLRERFGDVLGSEVYTDAIRGFEKRTKGFTSQEFLENKDALASELDDGLEGVRAKNLIIETIDEKLTCWALRLAANGFFRSGERRDFSSIHLRPEAMIEAALWSDLFGADTSTGVRRCGAWLSGFPRVIFISSGGDLFDKRVDFEWIRLHVIRIVNSPHGRRHQWVVLTKRSAKLRLFSEWLRRRGIPWPANLMPMVSVSGRGQRSRVGDLRRTHSPYCGVFLEPLESEIHFSLEGVPWIVVGGGSGPGAKPFDLAWGERIVDRCVKAGVAVFIKQIGDDPVRDGEPVEKAGRGGSDWFHWPASLRIRQMPRIFIDVAERLRSAGLVWEGGKR
jgi:protein gp37